MLFVQVIRDNRKDHYDTPGLGMFRRRVKARGGVLTKKDDLI